jgi:ATP-binding cassette, subfamily B, bacterial
MKPLERLWNLVALERKDIKAIYFYAILSGLLQLSVPLGIQSIVGFVMGATMVSSIVVLIILVVLGVLFVGIFQMNQMKIIERIQQTIFTRTAFEFTEVIPRLDLKKTDRYYLPEKVNRFFDTIIVQKSISKLLLDIPTASIQIIFGITLLSFYHSIFIIFGIILLTILWIVLKLSSTQGLITSVQESNYKYQVAEWLEEMARVLYSFKFSQGSHLNLNKTDLNVSNYLDARSKHFKILLFQYKTLIALKVLITTAMLVIGSILLIDQKLNVGEFIAAEIIIIMVISSVEKLIGNIDSVYDIITSLEKIGLITDSELEHDGTLILNQNNDGIEINISNLNFEYDENKKALHDITCYLPANSITCISGKDGSGKSTLLKLLSSNYSQFTGSITFNHIPIGNYKLESLRNAIGIHTQSQEIFKGTVWENISMGKKNSSVQEIMALAEKIGFENFIQNLPQGFETLIDPMGKRLTSTMTKQILLLRTLTGSSSLLLLDEPWQGFDDYHTQKIKNALLTHFKHKTIIIANNDELFAKQCDQRIILDKGKIVLKN